MPLTEKDTKYWWATESVTDYLTNVVIPKNATVLEIGPGPCPFPRANIFIDFVDIAGIDNLIKCDVAKDPLPFKDKEIDFVYARHLLEDMYNPFHLLREMSRVAKAGFIECPSPMAELGRGVDVSSPPFRGYHHHRYFVWVFGKELRLCTKYPFCEYVKWDDKKIEEFLRQEKYWNSFYLWEGEIAYNHIQSPLNYNIPTEYAVVLNQAMERAKEASDIFFFDMEAKRKVA